MVTLVVPVFNMETYLKRCIESLLRQSYQKIEILLVDDGSTDGSPEICEEYSRRCQRVKVVHKENGGLSSARNAGIEHASGKFITFPDPDDWVENNYVETFMRLEKVYFADMVCTGHYVDFEQTSREANPAATFKVMDRLEALKTLLLPPRMEGFAWNKLYRLDIVNEHGLRFTDSTGATEDMAFAYQYLKYCDKICFAPEERTYHYCQRQESATGATFSRRQLQNINVFETMIEEALDQEIVTAAKSRVCDTSMNQLWFLQNAAERDRSIQKLLLERIKKYRKDYLRNPNVSRGRKLQCVCALFSPALYRLFKNATSGKIR